MIEYEYQGVSVGISKFFRGYPADIDAGGRKTGKMRRWLRRSLLLSSDRRQELGLKILINTPLFNFSPRISLHKRRKQSRGFVSNRKSGNEGVRVEWESLNDTRDK